MGCVTVREDAQDWYLRSRHNLLKSILDGLEYNESVANFAFAKLNLQRHGYSIQKSIEDNICNSLIQKELSEGINNTINELIAESKTADTDRKLEILDEISRLEQSAKGMEHIAADDRNIEKVKDEEFHHEQKLTPHHWKDRFTERELKDVSSSYPEAPMDNDRHYPDAHIFHSKNHPLRKKHAVTGRAATTELLRSFYLPAKAGGKSVAEQYKEHEKDIERVHQKNENPAIIGHKKYDNELGREVTHHPFLGPLDDSYLHDIYQQHFDDWKDANPDIEKEINQQFSKPQDQDFALKQRHFEHAADSWESNDNHHTKIDPKEDMSEQEIQDFVYGGGNYNDLEPYSVSQGLGHMGYMMGMEFLDPTQRHKIMEHMHIKGSDAHDAQTIDLGRKDKISTGRIKRNIRQRMMPEFLASFRPQHLHGPNTHKHVEEINDHPDGEDFFLKHSLLEALMATKHDNGSLAQHLISEYNDILFDPDFLEYDEEGNLPEGLNHLPLRAIPQAKKIMNNAKKGDGENFRGALINELQTLDEEPPTYLSKKDLLTLCGYKEDGTPMNEDEHPLLPEFEGPFISPEKIDEVLEEAAKRGTLSKKQKEIRNFDAFHYLGNNGPEIQSIPENEKDAWPIGKEGTPIGLGSHFATPFHHQGGHGRSGVSYLEQLHDSLPKDEEGYSILGRVNNNEFHPNPKTVGLFGTFIPSVFDKRYGMHSGSHGISSLWDACSHLTSKNRIRNPKNNSFHNLTSLSGGYSNKIRYLTDDERKEIFTGSSMRKLLHDKGHFTTNPLLSIGKQKNKLIQTQKNSRMSHRLLTSLGRLYPPHAPAPFTVLNRENIQSGRFPLSHNEGRSNLFADFQGYTGIAGRSHRGLESRERREKQKGRAIKEMHRRQEDGDMNLSQDMQTNLEDLSDEYDTLAEEMNQHEEGSEEFAKVNYRLFELQTAMESIYEEARPKKGQKRGFTAHFDELEAKDEGDMLAIVEMAKRLKPILEKEDPEAFDPSNPEKFLANSARLVKDANRALLILPHSQHGLTTYGYGENQIEQKSVSQLLSEHMGEKTVPHHKLAVTLGMAGKEIRPDMSDAKILQQLGLPNDEVHQNLVDRLRENLDAPIRAMSHGDLLASGVDFHPKLDLSRFRGTEDHHGELDNFQINHGYNNVHHSHSSKRKKAEKGFANDIQSEYLGKLRFLESIMGRGYEKEAEKYGLSHLPTTNPQGEYGKKTNAFGKTTGNITGPMNETKSKLHDLFIFDPSKAQDMKAEIAPSQKTTVAQFDSGREIHPAGVRGHSVQDLYISGTMDGGYEMEPTVGLEFTGAKNPDTNINAVAGTNMESEMFHSVQQPILEALHGEEATEQVLTSGYEVTNPTPNILRPDILGLPPNTDPMNIALSDASETLSVLMNPDALLKNDKAKPPPILPMHRIFSLKDFESLRGFSGDWIVSAFYDGERMFITRKHHNVTAYGRDGESIPLEDKDKKQFKALTKRNYVIDVVRTKDEIHVIDVVNYDDTNIADLSLRERLKVLRGQFDSHEHVLVPGPHNTRMTEKDGLADTVKSLQEEHTQLLLRDSKSTYMLGEARHPKWFLLRGNKEISLIILDVRGKGPYTYRLGAGPTDVEGLGNRGVSYEGKNYLDVGTVKSPKPFNEGDVVKVSVSGVKRRKRNEKTLYDITPVKIKGEGDGEGAVSLESLSLLAKSHPLIAVSFQIEQKNGHVKVGFEGVDEVIYKLDSSHSGSWAHSPISVIGELSQSDYPVILAESVRPLWSQALSLMQKGIDIEDKESGEVETEHSMNDSKDRKRTEKESAGIIEAEDENNILKPKMETMVKTLARIADMIERVDTLEKEGGWPGARGLGIDTGSGIESPRGPTSLTSEESLPDWDMIDRPTEDMEEEYPNVRNKRLKQKNAEQSDVYEATSEDD